MKVCACGKEAIDVSFRGQGQISNGFPVFLSADGLPALSFSISSLTLIGMLAVITYTVSLDLRQVVDVVSCVQWSCICTVIKVLNLETIQWDDFPSLLLCSSMGPVLIETLDV